MKHLLLLIALGPLAVAQAPAAVQGRWTSDSHDYWTRNSTERWVSIQLERGDERSGLGVPERDVPALTDERGSGPVHFTVRRDAGTFQFDGQVSSGRGSGGFTFAPDAAYISGMAQLGYRLGDDDLWRFAIHDITREYVQGLQREGVRNAAASDLVKMRIHGVDPAYVASYRTAGYQLGVDDLVKTRIHGATPAFAQEVKKEGLGTPDVDDLVKMRIHGVTPEFIREMRDLGYKDLSIDRLVQMRIHGVTPEFVREIGRAHV